MVWKIVRIIIVSSVICAILGASLTSYAATHSVYENGTISSTYITYFKDIVSGIGFNDNYVAFRSGQNEYIMIVGDLEFSNDTISLSEQGKIYRFYAESSSYNSYYRYDYDSIDNFSLTVNNNIIYSDVGEFPQLVERGDKFEILTFFILFTISLCAIIRRIFFKR